MEPRRGALLRQASVCSLAIVQYVLSLAKMLLVDKYRPQSLKKMDYHTDMSEHLQNLVWAQTEAIFATAVSRPFFPKFLGANTFNHPSTGRFR